MPLSPIEQIAQAESEAAQTVAKAQQQAVKIVSDAEKQADMIRLGAEDTARAESGKMLDAARNEVKAGLLGAEAALEDEVAGLAVAAGQRRQLAVDEILAKISG